MDIKQITLAGIYRAMLPVIGLLLRAGITWKEFADLTRTAFVEVASDRYGLKGRRTNVSRVSILTGLSRREVRRQRERLSAPAAVVQSTVSNAARVLSGWHQDEEFLDAAGNPRELAAQGDGVNFRTLVRRHGGDLPPVALLKELLRAGSVQETPGGKLRAVSRAFCPRASNPQALLRACEVLEDLSHNIDHNLGRKADTPARFEGRATLDGLPAETADLFSAFVEREGQALLERADDWLSQHRPTHSIPVPGTGTRLGLGIFLIENQRN